MKSLLLFPVIFLSFIASGQQLSQVMISGGTTLTAFSVITSQKVLIRISAEGKIIEWGTDPGIGRYNYYTGQLQPYLGRVEYYGPSEYDSILRGKVKAIGTSTLTYYGSSENEAKKGKLRSIGSLQLDYFLDFENKDNKGKLKSIGYAALDYYSSFDNESFRNKLKTVGNTTLSWYSSFDDKLVKGKIKTIGTFNYTWYSSHDINGYGGLKSGLTAQNVNGVLYIIR
ncbi:MAG: hypothetical protein E6H09_11030 [Bacteroidetes bacterium]|nr:MAG: hypothetical protein E6H09_11030 [Bacteroidota bacterium]